MKYHLILICWISLITVKASPNNWIQVGDGFSADVRCFYVDSINQRLYAGGNFILSGNNTVNEIAVWNGIQWDSLGHGSWTNTPVRSMISYQGTLYASGFFYNNNDNYFGCWNGNNWDTACIKTDGPVQTYAFNGSSLVIGGQFQNVNNQPVSSLFLYDGSNITTFPFVFDSTFYNINSIEYYNGDLYIGGVFETTGPYNLARWDGASISQVGVGMSGGFDFPNILKTYQNELYIGGYFHVQSGNVGNNLMKWDGQMLKALSEEPDDVVFDMQVYNNELYICGAFDHIGNIPASKIAKWNGTTWSAISNDVFNNAIGRIAFYNNELYVGGGFTTINNIPVKHIAKCTLPIKIDDIYDLSQLNIFPNPAQDYLEINTSERIFDKVIIRDIINKEVYLETNLTANEQINVSYLSSGMYYMIIESKNERVIKRFVKQ